MSQPREPAGAGRTSLSELGLCEASAGHGPAPRASTAAWPAASPPALEPSTMQPSGAERASQGGAPSGPSVLHLLLPPGCGVHVCGVNSSDLGPRTGSQERSKGREAQATLRGPLGFCSGLPARGAVRPGLPLSGLGSCRRSHRPCGHRRIKGPEARHETFLSVSFS